MVADIIDQSNGRRQDEVCIALEHVESWTGRIRDPGLDVSLDSQVKRFQAGDVLFGKLRPYLAKVARPDYDGLCVGEFLVLRPRDVALSSSYLEQVLRSKPIIDAINGSTFGAKMPRADWNFIGGMEQPLPPLPEQTAIVRYLDHADERIRRYISGKQKLIRLLEEERQAVIHRAVTRGLDPNVRLKPSGVEWLGDVPAHWEVVRNGQLFAQRNETGFPELPLLEVSLKTGVRIRDLENSDRKQMMAVRSDYKRAITGDIAYNMMRMWQGAVGVAPVDGLVSPAYIIARPLHGTESSYFSALFRTSAYMTEVDKYSRGIVKDRNRLYWEDFKQMPSLRPPPYEQIAIVAYLDKATADIDTAISHARRQIELLQEYRTRLIADVVTGKIDVREAAAGLPDEAGELGAADADAFCDESDALGNEPSGGPLDTRANGSTDVPKMTPGRAVMVELMARYLRGLLDPFVTLLEVQKLMYFAQVAGEPLKLKFEKGPYGPYADNLRHVLKAMEGHLVSGCANGENAPDKELNLVPGAREDACAFLANHPETQARFDRVADCIEGFESSFGLELLSTVHWVVCKEEARTFDDVVDRTYAWDERKKQFSRRQLKIAVEVLLQKGWIENLIPSDTNEVKQPIDTEPKSQESTICH